MVAMKKKSALPLPVLQALAAAFLFALLNAALKILLGDIDPSTFGGFPLFGQWL